MLNCYWIIYHKISIETLQEIKIVQVLEQTGLGSKVNLLSAQTYFVLTKLLLPLWFFYLI